MEQPESLVVGQYVKYPALSDVLNANPSPHVYNFESVTIHPGSTLRFGPQSRVQMAMLSIEPGGKLILEPTSFLQTQQSVISGQIVCGKLPVQDIRILSHGAMISCDKSTVHISMAP